MKKIKRLFAVLLCAVMCLTVAGCNILDRNNSGNTNDGSQTGWGSVYTVETAYAKAKELGYGGTLEEFLEVIKGKDGVDGKDGVSITGATINADGELIITLSEGEPINAGKVVADKDADEENTVIGKYAFYAYEVDGVEYKVGDTMSDFGTITQEDAKDSSYELCKYCAVKDADGDFIAGVTWTQTINEITFRYDDMVIMTVTLTEGKLVNDLGEGMKVILQKVEEFDFGTQEGGNDGDNDNSGDNSGNEEGGNTDDGGNSQNPAESKTVIKIQGYEAGVNLDWLRELAEEFETLYANTQFEPGRKGVEFKIEGVGSTDPNSMLQSNIHMYVHSGSTETGRILSEKGRALSIDDVVSSRENGDIRYNDRGEPYLVSIREKVLPNYYNTVLSSAVASSNQDISDWYKQKYGLDDSFQFNTCYAMPSHGIQDAGLSYDAYNFNCDGLYLADPEWAANNPAKVFVHDSKFGTATFIKGSGNGDLLAGAKKACGNDGVFGTFDDGLPTSMEEFFILCEYMKNVKNIAPLTAYGGTNHPQRNRLATGFEISLSGANTYQTKFDYDSDGQNVALVQDFSNENAFMGIDYIKKANIVEQPITIENGYLATRTAARYYSIALLQIAYEEGWYSTMSSNSNLGHIDAEKNFILNGMGSYEKCGMLIEGNYWYNEAKKGGAVADFAQYAYYDKYGLVEPDIKWMSLPTKITGTVTEGNGTPYNAITKGYAPICINARYKDDANIVRLLKEFMKFIHTDEALSYYTGSQGVFRAGMEYDVSDTDKRNLSSFQKSYLEMYDAREMTIDASYPDGLTNATDGQVKLESQHKAYVAYQNGARNTTYNAKNIFEKSAWTEAYWNGSDVKPFWERLL